MSFRVLVHELAHSIMHFKKHNVPGLMDIYMGPPTGKSQDHSMEELEAESVAYTVCRACGVDSSAISSDYITLHAGDSRMLASSMTRIQTASSRILEAMDQQSPWQTIQSRMAAWSQSRSLTVSPFFLRRDFAATQGWSVVFHCNGLVRLGWNSRFCLEIAAEYLRIPWFHGFRGGFCLVVRKGVCLWLQHAIRWIPCKIESYSRVCSQRSFVPFLFFLPLMTAGDPASWSEIPSCLVPNSILQLQKQTSGSYKHSLWLPVLILFKVKERELWKAERT